MAIACFGLVTFLPLRPERSCPFFIARISRSTFLLAEGEYLREDFLEDDFLALPDFLSLELLVVDVRLALPLFLPAVLFFALALREDVFFFVVVFRGDVLFFAEEDFLEALARLVVDFFPVLSRALLDFFLAAFLVAMSILLRIRCWRSSAQLSQPT